MERFKAPPRETADAPEAASRDEGRKVAIVGAGLVGSTLAYTLMLTGVARDIVLVDLDEDRAIGQAMDISHGVALANPVQVAAGSYEALRGAQIVVVSAGVSQKPGETRLDLLKRNTEVFRDVIGKIIAHDDECVLLVATNPVDVLTYVAWRLSGLPASRVIGSGTVLDTSRLRHALGRYFQVDPRNVHAYVVGEHGDTELPLWSLANIAGIPIQNFPGYDKEALAEIFEAVRNSAYEIIRRKGATYFAIAVALARIIETVLADHRRIFTVSTLVQDYAGVGDVCIGVPAVVGQAGIHRILRLPLAPEEVDAFRKSAEVLKRAIASLELP